MQVTRPLRLSAAVRQLFLPHVPEDLPLPVVRTREDAERICGPGWWDACGLDCLLEAK